jgi:phage virion morphogenesis protein
MAGSFIEVTVDDAAIRKELERLAFAAGTLRPAMKNIGEYVARSTWERFNKGIDPAGRPWKPLQVQSGSSRMAQQLAKGTRKVLVKSGLLQNSFTYKAGSDSVVVGTNVAHAAIHQFGGKTPPHEIRPYRKKALAWPGGAHPVKVVKHPGSVIPARPFLGLSSEDQTEVLAILSDHLEGEKGSTR